MIQSRLAQDPACAMRSSAEADRHRAIGAFPDSTAPSVRANTITTPDRWRDPCQPTDIAAMPIELM
jgi:hypothetical protein